MRVLGSNEGAAVLVLVPAVAVVVAVAAAPMPGEAQDAGPMAEGEDAGNPVSRTRSPAAGTGDLAAEEPDPPGEPPPVPDPDPTRLDVERLPPEAIEVTRELYAHGVFLEAWLGARGFIGGAGDLFEPGPYLSLGLGLEVFDWLWVRLSVEGSLHQTDAPPPPGATAFEVVGTFAELRFQWAPTARLALWAGGEIGLAVALGDVLRAYGANASDTVGLAYGGTLGADWHLRNRHYSIGLLAGARLFPTFDDPNAGDPALGLHGAFYLRYVF